MSLIMQNGCTNVDVTSGCDSYGFRYALPSVEKSSCDRMDDIGFSSPSKSSIYIEHNGNDYRKLKLNMLPQNMFDEIQSSISDWEEYMYCKEYEHLRKSVSITVDLPAVRSNALLRYPDKNTEDNNSFSCSKIEIRSHGETWSEDLNETQKSQREFRASVEKAKGNVEYQTGDFIKACEHYSNCIALIPMKDAYNNRAQANIKLQNYESALPDLDEVLAQDPYNTKALTRRAICRMSMCMYHEALFDLQTILDKNPRNKEALSLKEDIIREISNLKGRKYRVRSIGRVKRTFEIDVSQLPVYAKCCGGGNYAVEMDKSGCAKSCVCTYCNADDLNTRFKSNSLRIRERPRWQRLTPSLLGELHVDVDAANNNYNNSNSCSNNNSRYSSSSNTTNNNHVINISIGNYKTDSNNNDNNNNNINEQRPSTEPKNDYRMLVVDAAGSSQATSQLCGKRAAAKTHRANVAYNSCAAAGGRPTNVTVPSSLAPPPPPPPPPTPTNCGERTKSLKRAANVNRRLYGVENGLQKLSLKEQCTQNGNADDAFLHMLTNVKPSELKQKFDSRLHENTLAQLIRVVCQKFELKKDWPYISECLKVFASLERFRIIISFVDNDTKNDLLKFFDEAVALNLENASHLKSLYFFTH